MDLRAQSQSQNQSSLGGGAADVLSTAASNVHDVLSTSEQPPTDKVKTVATRLPRSTHVPLYDAVHAAAEAGDMLENDAGASPTDKNGMLAGVSGYVEASPLQAVAVAFVAGWLIGRIAL